MNMLAGQKSQKQAPNVKVVVLAPSRPLQIYCLIDFSIEGELNHSSVCKDMIISMALGINNHLIYEP
jgi:hypothetical protein